MLIDTHAHLFWEDYRDNLDEVLENAKSCGVEKIVVPGTDLESSAQAVGLAKKYPGIIFASVGIHPEEVLRGRDHIEKGLMELSKLVQAERRWIVAIGEMGSDANTPELSEKMELQRELFLAQGELAINNDLPLIIHTRKTLDVTIEWLDQMTKMPRAVFHAYSHDLAGTFEVVKRGFVIGIGGNVSYSKRIQKVVQALDKKSYILETDAPFLPRGLEREPSSVRMLASIVSRLRNEPEVELALYTTENARRLFKI
jgi:TatD DNase family protein